LVTAFCSSKDGAAT